MLRGLKKQKRAPLVTKGVTETALIGFPTPTGLLLLSFGNAY